VTESVHQRALAEARSEFGRSRVGYFASIAGQRVAVAAMEIRDGVAYLSLAATRETHRGRGCQTALVRARLADAARAGAELAFSLVAAGSQSERNLVRAGLEIAYDRELWLPPDWTQHPFYRDAG
jgi:GNAT superfamily N-acetyltransferase